MIYSSQIADLIEKSDNKLLTIIDVIKWQNENWQLYLSTVDNYRCSQFILPCMCCIRGNDCLFIDIYKTLNEHLEKKNILEREIQLFKNELTEYHSISNDIEKTKVWLKRNLEKGLNTDLEYYAKSIITYSFKNGRDNYGKFLNEDTSNYTHIKITIDNENDFGIFYEFHDLFDSLFSKKKILPNDYENFKSE
jgi:hypothetical protein